MPSDIAPTGVSAQQWNDLKNPASDNSRRLQRFLLLLRQLSSEFDAFGGQPAATDLMAALHAIELPLVLRQGEVLRRHVRADVFLPNAIKLLLQHRHIWQEICDDPSLIPNAVEECMRHNGSVAAWRRLVTKDVQICGLYIPAGSKLLIVTSSANHDERHFEDMHAMMSVEPVRVQDKVMMDVESLDAGLLYLPVDAPQPGGVVKVGQLIGYLLEEGEPPPQEVPVTPRARRIASELGVDLSNLPGSGKGGRVREQDVRAAARQSNTEQQIPVTALRRAVADRHGDVKRVKGVAGTGNRGRRACRPEPSASPRTTLGFRLLTGCVGAL